MKKLIIGSVVIACIGWAIWPYYALYDLATGLESKNPVTLERRVVWDGVRHGLRDDLNAMFLAMVATDSSTKKSRSGESLSSGLSVVFGPAIIGQLVDAYVSPQILPNLIRHGVRGDLSVLKTISTLGEPPPISDWRKVEYAFFSGGPFSFVVELTTDSTMSKQPLTLLFKWSGDWKLARIFLPSDLVAQLAFDRAKAANTIEAWDAFLNYFGNAPLSSNAPFSSQARDERKTLEDALKQQAEDARAKQAEAARSGRAILYEEDPSNKYGKPFAGTITWRNEMVSAGRGLKPDMVARADVIIPETGLKISWSLRRITDNSLPASHTIEIMASTAAGFSSNDIGNVPGVTAKEIEKAVGIPLAGRAVHVAKGYFLIELSQSKDDFQTNVELLKTKSWFDIPIVYTNGRRGILAMEKGESGTQVFSKAFSYWEDSASFELIPNRSCRAVGNMHKTTQRQLRNIGNIAIVEVPATAMRVVQRSESLA